MAYRSTEAACWKCGQSVAHFNLGCRVSGMRPNWKTFRPKRKNCPMVPVRHLVEKGGHWQVCEGSGQPSHVKPRIFSQLARKTALWLKWKDEGKI